ncbi:hypothetical protein TL16_g03719 [Triparma laevis f. inornata]|uniref:Tryptophan synthase beta chain-like PALP domain-containing protein n=2 Tax=Triparma laevis TaxID=1534972 RepID=A0A9W6ZUJ4_9STRA|nr:hypothetical protein TrLO_g12682 [Triparma laevis f. longispina]GMH63458.1 hypothetical protein TL16_g03719 [Triparma laevis f. inornata]
MQTTILLLPILVLVLLPMSSTGLSLFPARRLIPYIPPTFISPSSLPPTSRIPLCNLPTPVHSVPSPLSTKFPTKNKFHLKRDDSTGGIELGGNKLRKLEFLLAQAALESADTLVTIGGIQSNHCRATACAGRLCGFDTEVILRCPDPSPDKFQGPSGTEGNLMYLRSSGSKIHTVTKQEYATHGSSKLLSLVSSSLKSLGKSPYTIPVGGSNALGTWGYISAASEFRKQFEEDDTLKNIKHIVYTTGSGGTAAGLTYGLIKSFEEKGYAISSDEEINFVKSYAEKSGVFLDTVYTGKAMYAFCKGVEEGGVVLGEGEEVLFWHTGGALGGYAEASRISSDFQQVKRMDL